MAYGSEWWRCPVDDGLYSFDGKTSAEAEWHAAAWKELTVKHWLTVGELYQMVAVAVWGPQALEEGFGKTEPWPEPRERIQEAKEDAAVLRLDPGQEELIAIWERAREGVRWVLARIDDPAQRVKIEAFLAEREARMARLLERG